MTADTITAIKKALEGVTPGPWVTYEGSLGYKGDVFAPTAKAVKDCHHIARCFAPRPAQSPLCDLQAIKVVDDAVAAVEANTIYIAAVNPEAISELLSTLESLQRENAQLKNLIDGDNCAGPDKIDALFRRAEAAEAEVKRLEEWLPIAEADKSIAHEQHFPSVNMTLRNSERYWVRDADGRVYEASWSEGNNGHDFWWDWEGESPASPIEFMPHPLARASLSSTGDTHGN